MKLKTHRRFPRAGATVTAALAVAVAVSPAAAGPYEFGKVVDSTSGNHTYIMPTPSMNNDGQVVYLAKSPGDVLGVYRGSVGTTPVLVASSSGAMKEFESYHSTFYGTGAYGIHSDPFITATGQVYTLGVLDAGPRGIYTFDASGNPVTVIDDTGPLLSATTGGTFGVAPKVAANGRIAFYGQLDGGGSGIHFAKDNAYTTAYAVATGSTFSAFSSFTGISRDGTTIGFSGTLRATAVAGIYRGTGGAPTLIADTSGPFSAFDTADNIVVLPDGRVAFTAKLDAGGEAFVVGDGSGTTTTLATTAGAFSEIWDVWYKANGKLGFTARLDAGGYGVFTGPDAVADKVIGPGDVLDGSTVNWAWSMGEGMNDNGQIVFWAQLADGRSGIYVADPVPEPTGMAVIAVVAAGLLTKRRRRSTRC